MPSVAVLILALFAPALSLPFAIPEYTPQIQIEQETSVTNNVPQIQHGFQEKTGFPVSSGCSAGYPVTANQDVAQPGTRVQDAPVNVEQTQSSHTETLYLPPQPVPQVDQILRPVIVPAEAIASGRVIIMAVESVQQRDSFPDHPVIVVPQQQPTVSEVQSVEKQTPYHENYSPVQSVQQTVQPNFNEVPRRQSQSKFESTEQQVHPDRQAVEKQVDQPVVQARPAEEQLVQQGEHIEKQVQSGADYSPVTYSVEPVRVQTVEGVHQKHYVQPTIEKESNENVRPIEPEPQQQVYTAQVVPQNVQKQDECATAQAQSESQQRVNVQETGEQAQQSEVKTYQQQPYSDQPEQVFQQQIQSVEPQKDVHQQVSRVQQPVTKTENQEVQNAPQQVSIFATEQVYNFGDKIPQQRPVDTPVHQQQYLIQPVVVGNQ